MAAGQLTTRSRPVVGLLCACAAFAYASTSSGADAPIRDELDRILREQRINGSVLVARGDRILLAKGYGYANRALRRPNTIDTQFRVTWLADQFTDVGLLQLHARGRINLDAPLCTYVSRCPPTWRSFTARQLQKQKVHFDPPVDIRQGTFAAAFDRLRRSRLVPGPRPRFLATANARNRELLKQFILMHAAGATWRDYVQRHILRPSGMSATVFEDGVAPRTRAEGYSRQAPVRVPDARLTPEQSDGMRSTVRDFYKYERALSKGLLLPSAAVEELQRAVPGSYIAGYHGVWQYGWLVGEFEGERVNGSNAHGEAGWSTMFMRFPDRQAVVLVFLNESRVPFDAAMSAARLVLARS